MNVWGIDTSCDDTAVAVVADGRVIRSSVIMSQTRRLRSGVVRRANAPGPVPTP